MRWLLSVVLIFALACGDEDREPFLPGGGGGGGSSETATDGGTPDGGDDLLFRGVLCAVTDVRKLDQCNANPDGLEVRIGTVSATSTAGGQVELALGPNDDLVDVLVSDPNGAYRPVIWRGSVFPVAGQDSVVIPVVSSATMTTIEGVLGEGPSDNVGTVIAHINKVGEPLAGAQIAEPVVGALGGIYYGVPDSPYLDIGAGTGLFGVAAHFGLPTAGPTVQLLVKEDSGATPVSVEVPVADNAVSFISYDFP